MEWLDEELRSFILDAGISFSKGLIGKLKMACLKKRLIRNLNSRILEKYGNAIFYNDLTSFLERTKLISTAIRNSLSSEHYESQRNFVGFYIGYFLDEYPQYVINRSQIEFLIKECFSTVYDTLNQTKDDSVRLIRNMAKELADDMDSRFVELHNELKQTNQHLAELVRKDILPPPHFNFSQYSEHVIQTYLSLCTNNYVPRSIRADMHLNQNCETEENTDTLTAVEKFNKVLLLADGGYGKTYEAVNLLNNLCGKAIPQIVIPVYLPLIEYGLLYSSIHEGVVHKLSPFCDGQATDLISEYFRSGRLIIILDGLDDIASSDNRTRFIADLRSLSLTYVDCRYVVTARTNRYRNELAGFACFNLIGYDQRIIRARLWQERITIDLPSSYYELFTNPLLLEAGISTLKNSTKTRRLNRSSLLEDFIILVYEKWNGKKGLCSNHPLTCSEFMMLIGQLAFESFDIPYYRFSDFEQRIIALKPNVPIEQVLNCIHASELFKTETYIIFSHKLFKEFCTAFYLYHNLPITKNQEFYNSKIENEEWKEVFILLSGLFTEIEQQDAFLDFVMKRDLKLYLECIKAKSEPYESLVKMEPEEYAHRFLTQILYTYRYFVNTYFEQLSDCFDPESGDTNADENICIRGCLTPDRSHITYWFERLPKDNPPVALIHSSEFKSASQIFERKAFKRKGRIVSHSELLNQEEDAGRQAAVKKVQSELKHIFEKKKLFESRYILCERVGIIKKKLSIIKDLVDYREMKNCVDREIERIHQIAPAAVGIIQGNVNLLSLQKLLSFLVDSSYDFIEDSLPDIDQNPDGDGPCYTWDLYSEKQKLNLISSFFRFYHLSYLEMVERNFPKLCPMFTKYRNYPFETIVYVDLKKQQYSNDDVLPPYILYFDVASSSNKPEAPQINVVDDLLPSDEAFSLIQESYRRSGREWHPCHIHSITFMSLITAYDSRSSGPLMDIVYKSIKDGLVEIWGDF